MANLFNTDFQDFLRALHRHEVRYVLVGGYSVIMHGYSRTTGDLDLYVEKSVENYGRLAQAFQYFGMPVFDMTAQNFLHNPAMDVFTFGRPPVAIDIITQLKGLGFTEAYAAAIDIEQDEIPVRLIRYEHLLQAKQAAGRARDRDDLDILTRKNKKSGN
jgi:predicted nucleotidyltransferase